MNTQRTGRNLAAFMFGFFLVVLVALIPELASAATTDPLTIGEADRMAQETNTIITVSTGALSFFLGWVAGASA